MNKSILILLLLLAFNSCNKSIKKFEANSPIYMEYNAFRSSVGLQPAQELSTHGSIYRMDPYLFIVSPYKGIHVFDNSNPSAPQNLGFLKIIGCTGMEIKGQYLLANSYIDLVVLDISNIHNPIEIARVEDVFPQALPPIHEQYPIATIDKEKGVVVGWKIKTVKEEITNVPTWNNCPTCGFISNDAGTSSNGAAATGISGSITKFSLINDYLYVMDGFQLIPFDISSPSTPISHEGTRVNRVVETLFAYKEHIFMGTTTGMLIYNTANPNEPQFVSQVNHMLACDPVVVQDDIAYVTIRSGRDCGGEINQLDIINVANFASPFIEKSYAMTNPHGLGIDGNLLFICDGKDGLKVFDAANPSLAGENLLHVFDDIQAVDIIPHQALAILISENSLRQYSYANPENFVLLSTIPIIP